MTNVTLITTTTGEQFIVEFGKGRCWHSEEIAEVEIEVSDNLAVCGICKQPISRIAKGQEIGRWNAMSLDTSICTCKTNRQDCPQHGNAGLSKPLPKCDGCYYCSRYGCNRDRGGHCAKLPANQT